MSTDTLDHRHRSLAPLVTVTVAAMVFTILLILVRLQWAPLESADHGAAADINSLIAGSATAVGVVKAVTWLGSDGVLWTVIAAATVILAIRRQWRLATYLLVTGAGADPGSHPQIAHGTGDSFPSGHSLGSIVARRTAYQGTGPLRSWKVPVGPPGGRVARRTMASVPSVTVCVPR